jgi:hypothetical protein
MADSSPTIVDLYFPAERVVEEAEAAEKVVVNLRFDAALLARVDKAAKRQGITRTAWLHRAAFDALGE